MIQKPTSCLGHCEGLGKAPCCLVEMFFFPNQQRFMDISGLKSVIAPEQDIAFETGIILSDALQRGSRQLYIHTHSHTMPHSRMPATGHLPEVPCYKTDSHCKWGCVWIYDSYIDI